MARYDKDKVIGMGAFGQVWLVKSKLSRQSYVLKEINLKTLNESEQQQALKESEILKRCKHDHIIRYKETIVDSDKDVLSIIMEYAEGGDLNQAILKRKGVPFTESRIITWFTQICLALEYIHNQNILHRDLKTQNIFLGRNKSVKVGDFGISRVLQGPDDLASTTVGTPYYLSPEICQRKPYNHKSDIWALGCILYELVTLEHAFKATDFIHLVSLVRNGRRGELPSDCNPFLRGLIDGLLNVDPKERPCTSEILANPVLQPYLSLYLTTQNGKSYRIPVDTETTSRRNSGGDIFKTKEHPLKRKNSLPAINPKAAKQRTSPVLKNMIKAQSAQFVNCRPCSSKTVKKSSSMMGTSKSEKEQTYKMSKASFALHVSKPISDLTRSCDTYVQDKSPCAVNDMSKFTKSEDFSFNLDYGYHTENRLCGNELLGIDSNGNYSPENMDVGDSTDHVFLHDSKCLSMSRNTTLKASSIGSLHDLCPHSQCHQCMLDTLWDNRIRGVGTVVDTEERTRLKTKLLSVYRERRFSDVYHYLASGWEGTDSTAAKNRLQRMMSVLTYEQVQSLPLMMQLIQLDMLVKSGLN